MQKYEDGFEKSVKENVFVFDSVDLLLYHHQKLSLNGNKLYVNSPKWLNNKKVTIKLKKSPRSFHYALTIALNYQSIKKALKGYQRLILLLNNVIGKR